MFQSLRVIIYVLGGDGVGLGHAYRCQALRDTLVGRGHQVRIATNLGGHGNLYVEGMPNNKNLLELFSKFKPDVIIFDLKDPLPKSVIEVCQSLGARVVSLLAEPGVDLSYPQDQARNIILRPELFDHETEIKASNDWLVFGGSEDRLNLLTYFAENYQGEQVCHLVGPKPKVRLGQNLVWEELPGPGLVGLVRSCGQACVSFGMIAWELAACGKPQYIFSLDQEHLKTALTLREAGLARVWPQVGLPSPEEFRDFLRWPSKPWGQRPDGWGAWHLVRRLEDLC